MNKIGDNMKQKKLTTFLIKLMGFITVGLLFLPSTALAYGGSLMGCDIEAEVLSRDFQ
jgi:hypothetical protein